MTTVSYLMLFAMLSVLTVVAPRRRGVTLFLALAVGLFLTAHAWRTVGLDRQLYLDWWNDFDSCRNYVSQRGVLFVWMMEVVHGFTTDIRYFFVLIAACSIGLKFVVFWKFSPLFWGAVLAYCSQCMIKTDMIAIRWGLSSAVFLFAVGLVGCRTYGWRGRMAVWCPAVVMASGFHTSGVLSALCAAFDGRAPRYRYFVAALVVCLVLCLSGVSVTSWVESLPFSAIRDGFHRYRLAMSCGEVYAYNVWAYVAKAVFGVAIACLMKFSPWRRHVPGTMFFLKVYTVAVIVGLLASDFPPLAHRSSQYLSAVEILLFPAAAVSIFGDGWPGRIGLVGLCGLNSLMTVFRLKMLMG